MPKRKRIPSKKKFKKIRNYTLTSKKQNPILSYNNLYDFNKSFIYGLNYINKLPKKNIINKKITADGNCFYNSISYYYHQTEEYNHYYRELIYNACLNSIDEIKEFMVSDYEGEMNDIDRTNKAINYVNNIKNNSYWAGDIEINKMALLLEVNILCYTEDENNYNLQGVYYGTENLLNLIPLKYVNNNHFELLFPLNYLLGIDIIPIDQDKLKQKLQTNNKVINKLKLPKIFNDEYIEYNKLHKNKYNEVFKFLNTKVFPDRIENIKDKKKA